MKREKKGVAGIIAGVFLAAILFSSVFLYFISVTEGQNTRAKAEIAAQDFKNEKLQETFTIRSQDELDDPDADGIGYINVNVNNTGGIPMTPSYLIVYDDRSVPILDGIPLKDSNPFSINGASDEVINTGNMSSSTTFLSDPLVPYRIDLISERGNIQTTTYPPPPLLEFEVNVDLNVTVGANLAETVFAQQTGSLILNYSSFGAIFTKGDLPDRDGIDQTGWLVSVKDQRGYPAWRLPSAADLTIAVKVKNKDSSLEDLYVLHPSAMVLSKQQGGSFGQETAFLCKVDESSTVFSPQQYDDSDLSEAPPVQTGVMIPNRYNATKLYPDPGWRNLYFCDIDSSTTSFEPRFKIGTRTVPPDMTYFFFVPRGELANLQPYAQTIPYQAVLATRPLDSFVVCLKSPFSTEDCANNLTDKYQGSPGSGSAGQFQVLFASPFSSPCKVVWIDQENTYTPLGEISNCTGGSTVTVDIPSVPPGYYVVQATDGDLNTYYMTFRVI